MTKLQKLLLIGVIFGLVGLLEACSRPRLNEVTWTLEGDIAAYRQAYAGNSEMTYRVDELAVGLESNEYRAFLQAVESAPAGSVWLVYYEVGPSAAHYMFALAVESDTRCIVLISDLDGVREDECGAVPNYSATPPADARAIRDPTVVGLVQAGVDVEVRRALTVLPPHESSGVELSADLFAKIDRLLGPIRTGTGDAEKSDAR